MTDVLDRQAATPLYVQLTNLLRTKISGGEWAEGQRIPSENELNRTYGISRMTARQVLAQLVSEGLLFRVQGKGTFVAPHKIQAQSPAYMGIREQLERQGYQTSTRLVSTEQAFADDVVAAALDLPVGAQVYVLRRLRLVEGEPISIHQSCIPQAAAPGLDERDAVGRQLCVVLDEDYGLTMGHVTETLESASATSSEARLLGVASRSPLLLLQQRVATPDRRPFEYSRIVFRGDRIRLQFHYDLTVDAGVPSSVASSARPTTPPAVTMA